MSYPQCPSATRARSPSAGQLPIDCSRPQVSSGITESTSARDRDPPEEEAVVDRSYQEVYSILPACQGEPVSGNRDRCRSVDPAGPQALTG
jgi:hypothetical protein